MMKSQEKNLESIVKKIEGINNIFLILIRKNFFNVIYQFKKRKNE